MVPSPKYLEIWFVLLEEGQTAKCESGSSIPGAQETLRSASDEESRFRIVPSQVTGVLARRRMAVSGTCLRPAVEFSAEEFPKSYDFLMGTKRS